MCAEIPIFRWRKSLALSASESLTDEVDAYLSVQCLMSEGFWHLNALLARNGTNIESFNVSHMLPQHVLHIFSAANLEGNY